MKRKVIALFTRLTLLVPAMLTCAQAMVPVRAQLSISSGWMTQPVILDGQITTATEWSDAVPVDLVLKNTPGVTIPGRIWIKNDLKWIYILAAVKWPANDIDGGDSFRFHIYDGPVSLPIKSGTISDESGIQFSGWTIDKYDIEGGDWRDDNQMSPPGQIDVRGGASYDGTQYWFEFGKPLNTGDRYDLVLVPGQTYSVVRLRFRDNSDPNAPSYDSYATLYLASALPSPWYATYWHIPIILVAVIVVIAAVTISRRRPPKLPTRPPEVKPFKIDRPPKPPTREHLLKELEELYRSGRIAETAYRRLKKKYEAKAS